MKLSTLVSQYVAYKQDMGMRFHTEARTLKSFCRAMGDISATEITAVQVHEFIAGTGPVTGFWRRKHKVLRGFYRFALARGHVNLPALPKIIPKSPEFVPYIYSHGELQRLLDAAKYCEKPSSKVQSHTWRALILLLYKAALRISEALSLTLADVDLTTGILNIRESKFYKTRLVPLSQELVRVMEDYVAWRAKAHSASSTSALFLTRNGSPLARNTAENVFRRLRIRVGVLRCDGGRYQPRLHDLRHSAAVHRLI
jgi:integrase/recombinase XerD